MSAYEELCAIYRERLHITSKTEIVIRFPFATLLGFRLKTTQPWSFLAGPSGGLKSTILRSMRDIPDVVLGCERMGEGAMMSGFRGPATAKRKKTKGALCVDGKPPEPDGNPYSLAKELDGKMLVIHDASQMATPDPRSGNRLYADLRFLFDGEGDSKFGNVEGRYHERSKFGLLAGVTNEIDRIRSSQHALGERFIGIRFDPGNDDADAFAAVASILRGHDRWMEKLPSRVAKVISGVIVIPIMEVMVPDELSATITNLGIAASWLRTCPSKTHRGGFTAEYHYKPKRERGTRISSELIVVAIGHALLNGRSSVTDQDVSLAREAAWGSVQDKPLSVASILSAAPNRSMRELSDLLRFPYNTTRALIEDLTLTEIMEESRIGDERRYSLSPRFVEQLKRSSFFEGYTP